MQAYQGQSVTYDGSDGQRHSATILHTWPDGSVTIRRGYYDPMEGTRLRFTPADRVRDYSTGEDVSFGPVLSPFTARALRSELIGKVLS